MQVVNLIGQGSIEEGMLAVLAFKKSLFAGVLDGGASEVFLQGTRLASFMKSVEQVAAAMGVDEGDEAAPAGRDAASPQTRGLTSFEEQAPAAAVHEETSPMFASAADGTAPTVPDTPSGAPEGESPAPDPWATLLQAGAALLQGLAEQRQPGAAPLIRIERDPDTGTPSLRLPLPDAALLSQLAKALAPWAKG